MGDKSNALIIADSLLRIAQDLPGIHDLSEFFFAGMAVRVLIRMVLHDQSLVLILEL